MEAHSAVQWICKALEQLQNWGISPDVWENRYTAEESFQREAWQSHHGFDTPASKDG